MSERYRNLGLEDQSKWATIRPDSLNNYSGLQLDDPKWAVLKPAETPQTTIILDQKEQVRESVEGAEWATLKNPDIWRPKVEEKTEERRENSMESKFTPVEALPTTVLDRSQPLQPILMPYQSVMDVETVETPKPERLKRADRQGGPTNKERHALRDLAAGRLVAPKIDEVRMQELLDQRAQQEQVSLAEGLQALDAAQDRTKGGVIVDFTK